MFKFCQHVDLNLSASNMWIGLAIANAMPFHVRAQITFSMYKMKWLISLQFNTFTIDWWDELCSKNVNSFWLLDEPIKYERTHIAKVLAINSLFLWSFYSLAIEIAAQLWHLHLLRPLKYIYRSHEHMNNSLSQIVCFDLDYSLT